MAHLQGSPPLTSAERSELVIWIDHHHVVALRHAPDGTPKIDVLERLPLESQSDFDARTAIYVQGRDTIVGVDLPPRTAPVSKPA